jgi:hypothetical protein
MYFLTTRPMWLLVLLVLMLTALTMGASLFIRRHVPLDRLRANNEVAGYKFATLGVLYAVLLAFAVVVVWERFDDAEHSVAKEAGAAATIYRLAWGIEGATGTALREALSGYLAADIEQDWLAMQHGHGSLRVTRALDSLYGQLLQKFQPANPREAGIQTAIMNQLDLLTQAREERLARASGTVPGIIWLVLFTGAVLAVGFTFFFGTPNASAQALMTGALCLLILLALLIVVTVDRPFSGSVVVTPEPLAEVLADFRLPAAR